VKTPPLTSRFGLPLLAKELIEQAARKRTYILRVTYAVLLFVVAFLIFHDTLRVGRTSPFAILGKGAQIFSVLMGLQFAGVYLFMPAITCGVITQEKERNSLMLLFLTRLGPWTIVFEKLLGRLIPMACFLLLSLPLLAFAYSIGGISAEYLWSGVWMLGVAALQMGTLAVFCSAWFRTTVGAFVWSYLFALLMFYGPIIVVQLLLSASLYNSPLMHKIASLTAFDTPEAMLFMFFAPAQFFVTGAMGGGNFKTIALRSIPILMSCGVFMVLARAFVVRRAFVPPRNIVLNFFKLLDRGFHRLNENRVTRGIVLIRDKSVLPDINPVAWRETTKRSLGRSRYLFRIFVVIEGILGAICMLIAMGATDGSLAGASMALFLLWFVSVLMISVQSASLIAGERSHQTLDVLSTTPLVGRQILLQKFRGVQRLMIVLLVPFFTIFVFEIWWRGSGLTDPRFGATYHPFDSSLYFICSTLSVGIYLPLAAWLSLLIGLVVRTHARAIVAALGALVGWCILPLVFIFLPIQILIGGFGPDSSWTFLFLFSPMMIVPFNEFNGLHEFAGRPWEAMIVNFVGYGTMLILIRRICLINADRFLGRAESQ
jgi:ABC-type transport system involved in multi-copper enzyme maturation permease subunit